VKYSYHLDISRYLVNIEYQPVWTSGWG